MFTALGSITSSLPRLTLVRFMSPMAPRPPAFITTSLSSICAGTS